MAFDILTPKFLLEAVEDVPRRSKLLTKRYFTTTRMFYSDEILVEYKRNHRLAAPVVIERSSGIVVSRGDFDAFKLEPFKISVARSINPDDLKKLRFGENPLDPKTEEQRAKEMAAEDLVEMGEMVDIAYEAVVAELMLHNGLNLDRKNIDGEVIDQYQIKFYQGDNPSNVYTPTVKWDAEGADILGDLGAMVEMRAKHGLPSTEILVSPDVADLIQNDPKIRELLDNRRIEVGGIKPEELTESAYQIGTLYPHGRKIDIIAYPETYEVKNGGEYSDVPYLPAGTVIMLYPGCGKLYYGQITQLEQADGEFHTYAKELVPKHTYNPESDHRRIQLTSKGLPMPEVENAWTVANVITA